MGSKTFKKFAVPLVALALGAAPAAALAMPNIDGSKSAGAREYQAHVAYKDYSKNGATGDFTPAVNVPSGAPVTTSAQQASDDGFAWGAAALGAGSMLLIVVLVGTTSRQLRRRRIAPPTPAHPSAV
jgi:hypothetical protein